MPPAPARSRHPRPPAPQPQLLVWFIACMLAVIAMAYFTIRYNLAHERGKDSANVFSLVRQKFQGFSPPPLPAPTNR